MPEGIRLYVPAVKGGKFSHVLLTYYNQKMVYYSYTFYILSFSSMDEYSMKMRKFLLLCIFTARAMLALQALY